MRFVGEFILSHGNYCLAIFAYEGGTGCRQDCHWGWVWDTRRESEYREEANDVEDREILGDLNDRIVHILC
jgi:hypothetical protein